MKEIKNLKILAAGLCLGVTLLTTGCGSNAVSFGNSDIVYESVIPEGTISYDDLNNLGKLVTIETEDGKKSTHFLMKKERDTTAFNKTVSYSDLKTGAEIIQYNYSYLLKDASYKIGESLNIIDEKDITNYLLEKDYVKKEYEINELISFIDEQVLSTLNSNDIEVDIDK